MIRIATSAVGLAVLLAGFGSTAARSADAGYVAVLVEPALRERLVVHGLLWRCAGERCVAPAGNSRPAIMCEALAKAVGPLSSFTGGDVALTPEQLAHCNRVRSMD